MSIDLAVIEEGLDKVKLQAKQIELLQKIMRDNGFHINMDIVRILSALILRELENVES